MQLDKWVFETNLKSEHIVSQVIHFAEILQQRGEHITNLVFMGMGEPMANYDEMIRAVKNFNSSSRIWFRSTSYNYLKLLELNLELKN